MPNRLFRRRRYADSANALYLALVAQARRPVFYEHLGVPDTVDGRFDMIALHAFLLMHRLKGERATPAGTLAQELFDLMFADMDRNLREMGVGDLGISRRVKTMVSAFYGRIKAYEEALATEEDSELAEAVRRNLFRGASPASEQGAAMVVYIRTQIAELADQALPDLLAGRVRFIEPAAPA